MPQQVFHRSVIEFIALASLAAGTLSAAEDGSSAYPYVIDNTSDYIVADVVSTYAGLVLENTTAYSTCHYTMASSLDYSTYMLAFVGKSTSTAILSIEGAGTDITGPYYFLIGGNHYATETGTGEVSVSGGASLSSDCIEVGFYGSGALTVSANSSVTASTMLLVGNLKGSSTAEYCGTVNVEGTGASIDAADLRVGYLSDGLMNVRSGATVTAQSLIVGDDDDCTGEMTLDSSTLAVTVKDTGDATGITVGKYSNGSTMTITNSSTVTCTGALVVGKSSSDSDYLSITGNHNTLTISGGSTVTLANPSDTYKANASVYFAQYGWYNTLTVKGASTLSCYNFVMGIDGTSTEILAAYTGSHNTATITGQGTKLVIANNLYLYNYGSSSGLVYGAFNSLQISDGALMQIDGSLIYTGSTGTYNCILLDGGYIAIKGELDATAIAEFISGIWAYDDDGDLFILSAKDTASGYYLNLLSVTYYDTGESASSIADTGYDLAGYTVLASLYSTAVPEPATFAIFAGIGAIGLALRRRRA